MSKTQMFPSFTSPGGFPGQQPQGQFPGFTGQTTNPTPGAWGSTPGSTFPGMGQTTNPTGFPGLGGQTSFPQNPMQPATSSFTSFGTNPSTGFTMPGSANPLGGGLGTPLSGASPWGATTTATNPLGGGLGGTTLGQPNPLGGTTLGQPNPLGGGSSIWGATQPQTNPLGGGTSLWNPSGANPLGGGLGGTTLGQPNPMMGGTSTPWNATQTSTPWGATTQQPGSSFLGGAPGGMGMGGVGSGNPPFQPTQDYDGGNQSAPIRMMTITAMQQYKNKSFEELRYEDYRKAQGLPPAATSQQQPSLGGLGQTNPLGGLGGLGQTNPLSLGGAPGTTLFPSTTQPGGSLFPSAQPQQQPGGLFMPSPSQNSGFIPPPGGSTTNPLGGLFAPTQQPGGSLFPSAQPGGSLFPSVGNPLGGAQPQGSSLFPSTTMPSLGGQGSSLFPSLGGLGTTPGQQPGGLFAPTANPLTPPGGSLFPSATMPSLGTPSANPLGSLFPSTNPSTTMPSLGGSSLFPSLGTPGQANPSSLLASPLGTSLGQPSLLGGLGTTASNPLGSSLFPSTTSSPLSAGGLNLFPSLSQPSALGGAQPNALQLQQLQQLQQQQAMQKPPAIATIDNPLVPNYSSRISTDNLPTLSVVAPSTPTQRPPRESQLSRMPSRSPQRIISQSSKARLDAIKEEDSTNFFKQRSPFKQLNVPIEALTAKAAGATDADGFPVLDSEGSNRTNNNNVHQQHSSTSSFKSTTSPPHKENSNGNGFSDQQQQHQNNNHGVSSLAAGTSALLPKIAPEWFTEPSMAELAQMTSQQLASVDNFSVGSKDNGKMQAEVRFEGLTDIRGLNLTEIIELKWGEVTVYPDDSRKPPVGQALNKPAVISLWNIYPRSKTGSINDSADAIKKYREQLKSFTAKQDADFLEYSDEGIWRFRVKHFTRYGLLDDNNNAEMEESQQQLPQQPLPSLFAKPQPQTSQTKSRPLSREQTVLLGDSDNLDISTSSTTATTSSKHNVPSLSSFNASIDLDDDTLPVQSITNIGENNNASQNQVMTDVVAQNEMEETPIQATTRQQNFDYYINKLGLDSPRLQLLKGTLASSPSSQNLNGANNNTNANILENDLLRKQMSPIPTSSSTRSMSSPSTQQQQNTVSENPYPYVGTRSKITGMKRSFEVIEVSTSVLKSETFQDLRKLKRDRQTNGMFLRGSFRAGWGPNGLLIHSGLPILSSTTSSTTTSTSGANPLSVSLFNRKITLEKLGTGLPNVGDRKSEIALLEAHKNSTQSTQPTPKSIPINRVSELDSYLEKTLSSLPLIPTQNTTTNFYSDTFETLRWSLKMIEALWGSKYESNKFFPNEDKTQEPEMWKELARRFGVNQWFKDKLSWSQKNFPAPADRASSYAKLFDLLSRKQISEATVEAIHQRNLRLSSLFATCLSDVEAREAIKTQLQQWRDSKTSEHINPDLLKIYKLLGGELENVSQGLDWERCFALALWFGTDLHAPIQKVLETYNSAKFSSPLPSYLRHSDSILAVDPRTVIVSNSSLLVLPRNNNVGGKKLLGMGGAPSSTIVKRQNKQWETLNSEDQRKILDDRHLLAFQAVSNVSKDVNFQLISLYSDPKSPLRIWQALETSGISPFPMDVRIAWHLFGALSTCANVVDINSRQNATQINRLHTQFALQLELEGMWVWSVYVLTHLSIQNPSASLSKDQAIKTLISRHSNELANSIDAQSFITSLGIPRIWIDECLAWREMSNSNYLSAVRLFIRATQYQAANDVLLTQILSHFILQESHDELESIMIELSKQSSEIEGWQNNGRLYLDYLIAFKDFHNCPSESQSWIELQKRFNEKALELSPFMKLRKMEREMHGNETRQDKESQKMFQQQQQSQSQNTKKLQHSNSYFIGESKLEVACLSKISSFYSESLIQLTQAIELSNASIAQNNNNTNNQQTKPTKTQAHEQRRNELLRSLNSLEVAPDDQVFHLQQFAQSMLENEMLSVEN